MSESVAIASPAPRSIQVSPLTRTRMSTFTGLGKLQLLRRSSDDGSVGDRISHSSDCPSTDATTTEQLSPLHLSNKRKSFFGFRTSSPIDFSKTPRSSSSSSDPDMKIIGRLHGLLGCSVTRNEFVAHLLGEHRLDLVLRIRFVCAVNELLRCEDLDKEWHNRARQVVRVFVDQKSNFHLPADSLLPSLIREVQVAYSAETLECALDKARQSVIARLASDEVVVQYVETESLKNSSS